jgi:hypothetical protein
MLVGCRPRPKKYGVEQIQFAETGGMAFHILYRHGCYISMCIIQEYVTMTGLVTKYAIGYCGARLVQIAVVQLGYPRFLKSSRS